MFSGLSLARKNKRPRLQVATLLAGRRLQKVDEEEKNVISELKANKLENERTVLLAASNDYGKTIAGNREQTSTRLFRS